MKAVITRLWDAEQAARWVIAATEGWDEDRYRAEEITRFAVERQLTIVGEALSVVRRDAPDLAARLSMLAGVVGFRNLAVHGYADIDDAQVWVIVSLRLPELVERLSAVRAELDEGAAKPS